MTMKLNDQNHFVVLGVEVLDFFTYINVNLKKLNHLCCIHF